MNDIEVLEWFLRICDEDLYTEISIRCDGRMRKAIENLLKENKDLQKSVDQIYEDYQDIGKMYFNLTEKIESKIEEINSRIEKYREYAERGIETDVEWVDNVADREIVKVLEELLKGE